MKRNISLLYVKYKYIYRSRNCLSFWSGDHALWINVCIFVPFLLAFAFCPLFFYLRLQITALASSHFSDDCEERWANKKTRGNILITTRKG
jgi:hypothetical protein